MRARKVQRGGGVREVGTNQGAGIVRVADDADRAFQMRVAAPAQHVVGRQAQTHEAFEVRGLRLRDDFAAGLAGEFVDRRALVAEQGAQELGHRLEQFLQAPGRLDALDKLAREFQGL